MIIKASQRGGANKLAIHLLNANDNEHVKVHEVTGFVSETMPEALNEAYAISKGTRCKQFLFSVSLSPPQGADVSIETFEETALRIEKKLGLEGQPRVFVFHEKNSRRHAHVVWSRIDRDTMTAKNLSFFKNRLMEVSKEMYLANEWKLPEGFINRKNRNPLNFTREEWQQAKRLGDDPKEVKAVLQECWSISKDKESFKKSLERNGYYLAQGDRRGFVAIDWRGEVYSLSRSVAVNKKDLQQRLGDEKDLPTAAETKANIDQQLVEKMKGHLSTLQNNYRKKISPLLAAKVAITERHRAERLKLAEIQARRRQEEQERRLARHRKGIAGLWNRFTGKHGKIQLQNEFEAYEAGKRDQVERDSQILAQIKERSFLQRGIDTFKQDYEQEKKTLRECVFSNMSDERIMKLESIFHEKTPTPSQSQVHEM